MIEKKRLGSDVEGSLSTLRKITIGFLLQGFSGFLSSAYCMKMATPIRVLIVDDSALVRKVLSSALAGDRQIEVVGTAPDAYIARDKIMALHPDVITLDIEMPGMDGLTFLKKLMQYRPIPVIIISSLGQASCQVSIEALRLGAVEILAKPNGPFSVGELGITLASKIRAAATARLQIQGSDGVVAPSGIQIEQSHIAAHDVGQKYANDKVIAIGASTGGPQALAEVLRKLPSGVPPILIVQHMPAVFTRHFAERLNHECAIDVKEAEDGDELVPGRALLAPGNLHMTLRRSTTGLRVWLSDGPPVCFSRPSVDVLFSSVAIAAGKSAIGILLTGMGADGARGLLAMRNQKARTFAQDENTCVVYGMPKEAVRLDAVEKSLPLKEISRELLQCLTPMAKTFK